jgi:hypothetical protein
MFRKCFPEVGIGDKRERKKILDAFAREKGFDPQNPENWYAHAQDLLETKVSPTLPVFIQ